MGKTRILSGYPLLSGAMKILLFFIDLDKNGYQVNIFLHENICCGYSLEAPH